MSRIVPVIVLALLAAPLAAQQDEAPAISLEQRMLLRCSAAFALVAHDQQGGDETAAHYPPMAERGREFFVRASARVMDDSGLDMAGIEQVLQREALDLRDSGQTGAIMPVCLQMLDQSGL